MSKVEYLEFLKSKKIVNKSCGIDVELSAINDVLYPFQKQLVQWALKKGKAAIFADCGLGKTFLQLEWARLLNKKTLIVAPLAVANQTVKEGKKIDIHVDYVREQSQVKDKISITNYEMIERFNPSEFGAVVLDESSILKSYMGKTKQKIINRFAKIKYKLCCTATPSPNDHMEILNHAEFLDVMKSHEALAIWFINDTMNMGSYRLKHHAVDDFWRWVVSWAIGLQKPSDLGDEYDDKRFELPELNVKDVILPVDIYNSDDGELFRFPAMNATDFHKEKRRTIFDRAKKTAEIVGNNNGVYCVWCDTNYEADVLKKEMPEAIEIRGSDSITKKESTINDFINEKIRVLISKPSIFGFGLNLQHCHNIVYCGMNFSYESYYQSVRRFWRFGQKNPVNVYIVLGETEKNILEIIKKKEKKYLELKTNMQKQINKYQDIKKGVSYIMDCATEKTKGDNYEIQLGDAVELTKEIKSESVHFTIFSPPFSNLYIYSDNYRDMGNSKNDQEFFENFNYLIPDLYRITLTGRLCAVHCKQLVNYANRDGQAGLRDFRGDIIRAFQACGWIYHSEVLIWKDPLTEMQRTKAQGLLHNQICRDSSYCRQGLPDYLIIFRKWGEKTKEVPVARVSGFEHFIGDSQYEPDKEKNKDPGKNKYSHFIWQRYASPVWYDINQMNVLNTAVAKDNKDEKHICPLQLDVIERSVELWTNPGEIVFSPFAGIGSEGYGAIKNNRRFIGIELKPEYYHQAIKNLERANDDKNQQELKL